MPVKQKSRRRVECAQHEWEFVTWLEWRSPGDPFVIDPVGVGGRYYPVSRCPRERPARFRARCKRCGAERDSSDIEVCPTCFAKMEPAGVTPGQGERIHHYSCPNGHHESGST